MKRNILRNLGTINVEEIAIMGGQIEVFVPVDVISNELDAVIVKCENKYREEHPEVDLSQYTLYRDIALHMNINDNKVSYSVAIILWIQDEDENEIHVEFYDPFEIEINAEDNKYLKKLVMNKLMEAFF